MIRANGGGRDEPAPGASISRHADADHLIITVAGELTAADAPCDLLAGHLVAGVRSVRVDVSGLTFADVAGLRILLRAREQCAAQKVEFTLHRPTPYLVWLLELTEALRVPER